MISEIYRYKNALLRKQKLYYTYHVVTDLLLRNTELPNPVDCPQPVDLQHDYITSRNRYTRMYTTNVYSIGKYI